MSASGKGQTLRYGISKAESAPGDPEPLKRLSVVSVVIPALNEDANLRRLLPRLVKVISKLKGYAFELIVIDDGSEDSTSYVAREFKATVIRHEHPLGNGAAVKRGIREAKGDWILLMDGDCQHPPEAIPKLLEHSARFDMVVGSRTSKGKFPRNLANSIYNWLATYVTGRKIEDLTSGFRLVKAEALRSFVHILPNTFSYPTTVTLAMIKAGYSVKYVPFTPGERAGKSKIRIFRDGARFFLIIIKIATLFSPLRIFIPLACMVWFMGIVYYLFTFMTSHRFTNMGLLLLVQGSILFMLGLISEQIAQLRFERSPCEKRLD